MSGLKDVVKRGWHPETEGTTFKSQVVRIIPISDMMV